MATEEHDDHEVRPRRRRSEEKVDQTVYPMPQSEQPHPVYGFAAPNPYAEEAK